MDCEVEVGVEILLIARLRNVVFTVKIWSLRFMTRQELYIRCTDIATHGNTVVMADSWVIGLQ